MRITWTTKKLFRPIYKSLVVIFLAVVAGLVAITVWFERALEAPGTLKAKKTFVIEKGESPSVIVDRLYQERLIKSPVAFRIYLKVSGLDVKIQAGRYEISSNLSASELAHLLTKGRFDKKLTIIEGLRKEEVAEILEKEFGVDKKEFLNKAKEGYVFPDTYLIPNGSSVDEILTIVYQNFNQKVTGQIIDLAKKNGISKEQLIVLASIVEREARDNEQRSVIAGILIKRWKSGTFLGADATVQYALGYSSVDKTWWRKNLTAADLETNSAYNTRKNVGLPPGPICSPGISSIEAVAKPKDTPYLYYLHDKNGIAYYAETLEEHQQNIQKHLN